MRVSYVIPITRLDHDGLMCLTACCPPGGRAGRHPASIRTLPVCLISIGVQNLTRTNDLISESFLRQPNGAGH